MSIHDLPTDTTQQLSYDDETTLRKLFTQKATQSLDRLMSDFKTPVVLGIIFTLLGTPITDLAVYKALPVAQNHPYIYTFSRVCIFMIIVYVYINK